MIYNQDEIIALTLRAANNRPERELFTPSQLTAITQAYNSVESPWVDILTLFYVEDTATEDIAIRLRRPHQEIVGEFGAAVIVFRLLLRHYGLTTRHGYIHTLKYPTDIWRRPTPTPEAVADTQYVRPQKTPPTLEAEVISVSTVPDSWNARPVVEKKEAVPALPGEIPCPLCRTALKPPGKSNRFGRCPRCYLALRIRADHRNHCFQITIFDHAKSPMPKTLDECHACLGSTPGMSLSEIRSKYLGRLNHCHPDRLRNRAPEVRAAAEHLTKQTNAAWDIIKTSFTRI